MLAREAEQHLVNRQALGSANDEIDDFGVVVGGDFDLIERLCDAGLGLCEGDVVGQLSGNRVGLDERDSNVRDEFEEIGLGPAVDSSLRLEQAFRSFGKTSCGRSRS